MPRAPGQDTGILPGSRRTVGSLAWAVLVPLVVVAAGLLSQYPYGGLYAGVLLILAAAATAAIVAGGIWHRGGAATLATAAAIALGFFAGPTLYEVYVKQAGDTVDAVVTGTGTKPGVKRDTELDVCRVVDASGEVTELSQQQNCFGQFRAGQHVTLFKDPLGGLDPWIEATADRSADATGPVTSGTLFLVTAGALFWAGQRRRMDGESRDKAAKALRRNRPRTRTAQPPAA